MNIKKLLLCIPLLTFSTVMFSAHYVPVAGPIMLSDHFGTPGTITSTLLADNKLQEDLICINAFTRQAFTGSLVIGQRPFYQEVIQRISTTQTPLALRALEAYERVIMYIYQDKAYLINAKYNPYYPIQGIRSSWINPIAWLDLRSWWGDYNDELDQLLNELDQLATIAMGKRPLTGQRMKMTIHTYRHWRRYTMSAFYGTVIAYLCHDIGKREQNDTIVKAFMSLSPKKIVKQMYKNTTTDLYDLFFSSKTLEETTIDVTPINQALETITPQAIIDDAKPNNLISGAQILQDATTNTTPINQAPETIMPQAIIDDAKPVKINNILEVLKHKDELLKEQPTKDPETLSYYEQIMAFFFASAPETPANPTIEQDFKHLLLLHQQQRNELSNLEKNIISITDQADLAAQIILKKKEYQETGNALQRLVEKYYDAKTNSSIISQQ